MRFTRGREAPANEHRTFPVALPTPQKNLYVFALEGCHDSTSQIQLLYNPTTDSNVIVYPASIVYNNTWCFQTYNHPGLKGILNRNTYEITGEMHYTHDLNPGNHQPIYPELVVSAFRMLKIN